MSSLPINLNTPIERNVFLSDEAKNIQVFVKRDDLIHPFISGNKWYKLAQYVQKINQNHLAGILTFGGAFSNHILATACAGYLLGFKTIGIIRGEELNTQSNLCLQKAQDFGMQLSFVNRLDYRQKDNLFFLDQLKAKFGDNYLIVPEGGAGVLGALGAKNIWNQKTKEFDYILHACGTGTSLAGIVLSALPDQHIIGVSVLKGDFLTQAVQQLLNEIDPLALQKKWKIINDYALNYAQADADLLGFISQFNIENHFKIEPVYTGKLFYKTKQLLEQNFFPPNSKILLVHSGGVFDLAHI